jgi:2,5-furandicarboxylate decarboxylase 1
MHDLRTFLDTVRRERPPRDIVDIGRTVSPKHETTAILTKLEQSYHFPILCFRSVAGSPFPVVTNVCGSVARLALALRCSVGELSRVYAARCAHPVKPEVKSEAPAQERVLFGKDVNLESFPQFVYHEDDASQPFITAAIVVACDPETGKSNLSFHRLMIVNRTTTAIFMARGKHLDQIYRKYESAGQPMPIAAFLGVHPACSLGALYTGSAETEEYDIIGGLQQSPLALVNCVTNPLRVPADAEFVLEGLVPPRTRVDEGPFGEFTGYSTGNMLCPMFEVQAVTSRQDPVFQDIVSGHSEHLLLPILGMEHYLLEAARTAVPTTVNVRLLVPLTAFVALNKKDDSQPQRIIESLLASDIYIKQVIVVDADVNTSDLRQVATAVALHVMPDRDVYIHRSMLGTELDPSCESADGSTAKLGIDATLPLKTPRTVLKNRVPKRLLDSINISEFLQTGVVGAVTP